MKRHVLRQQVFVPLFRAAICPPNSPTGSMNQNSFIPRNNSLCISILIPIRQAGYEMVHRNRPRYCVSSKHHTQAVSPRTWSYYSSRWLTGGLVLCSLFVTCCWLITSHVPDSPPLAFRPHATLLYQVLHSPCIPCHLPLLCAIFHCHLRLPLPLPLGLLVCCHFVKSNASFATCILPFAIAITICNCHLSLPCVPFHWHLPFAVTVRHCHFSASSYYFCRIKCNLF